MAKIEVSALLNAIRGRLGDAVYVQSKGINYVRLVSESTLDPNTGRTLQLRANLGTASAGFGSLTPGQQDLWRQYAISKHHIGGARAAYISLSCNLLHASHSDLVVNPGPPSVPGTPRFPNHFCVTNINDSHICLQWTEPADTETYVTGHFKVHRGFCLVHPCYETCPTTGYSWGPRFVGTARADSLALQHIHPYPPGSRLKYWLNSIDRSGRKSPITHAIPITTRSGPYFWMVDQDNERIMKRHRANLGFIAKIGTHGSGDDQFNRPRQLCADNTYLYVADTQNDRIVKRRKDDLSYVSKIGSTGSGDDQFNYPYATACDDRYLYVADCDNHRIVKRLKSDLSFISKIGSLGSGDDQFNQPRGIAVDGTHVFVVDATNNRIVKRKKLDLSYVSQVGSTGSGNDQFNAPRAVAVDDTHIFITDKENNRIVKRLKSDLTYVSKIGSSGSGDDQFSRPLGICVAGRFLLISEERDPGPPLSNQRISKRLKSDLSFVMNLGGEGSGDNQFDVPYGITIQHQYS